jgi:hypothetical protein
MGSRPHRAGVRHPFRRVGASVTVVAQAQPRSRMVPRESNDHLPRSKRTHKRSAAPGRYPSRPRRARKSPTQDSSGPPRSGSTARRPAAAKGGSYRHSQLPKHKVMITNQTSAMPRSRTEETASHQHGTARSFTIRRVAVVLPEGSQFKLLPTQAVVDARRRLEGRR